MRFYAAPMEGLTGYVFRNAHCACFPGADRYFTPFVSPNQHHELSSRELNDILPENNAGVPVIPQILTNHAGDFLWACREMAEMGYDEVNLNLGCPSPTVVTKGKGSGMLNDIAALRVFLDEIYEHTSVKISIKTRIGLSDEGNWESLIELFNGYPISELIVHPRIQSDMYKKPVRPAAFDTALRLCRHPLIYNGDIFSAADARAFSEARSGLTGLMCGRGLIAIPHLFMLVQRSAQPSPGVIRTFHDLLLEGYAGTMPGEKATLFKMKELWHYMSGLFPDRGSFDKKLKKTERISTYTALINDLFETCAPDLSAPYQP